MIIWEDPGDLPVKALTVAYFLGVAIFELLVNQQSLAGSYHSIDAWVWRRLCPPTHQILPSVTQMSIEARGSFIGASVCQRPDRKHWWRDTGWQSLPAMGRPPSTWMSSPNATAAEEALWTTFPS